MKRRSFIHTALFGLWFLFEGPGEEKEKLSPEQEILKAWGQIDPKILGVPSRGRFEYPIYDEAHNIPPYLFEQALAEYEIAQLKNGFRLSKRDWD